jgi:hypothetical protein
MEQIPAMSLEIQALAGSIGRDQNPNRMLVRISVKGVLDRLAFVGRSGTVIDGDSLVGSIRTFKDS